MFEAFEADELQQFHRHAAHFIAPEALNIERQQRVVEDSTPGEQHWGLEHHAYIATRAGDAAAEQVGGPVGGRQQACQNAQQGGFAAAGWGDDGNEFTVFDAEGD